MKEGQKVALTARVQDGINGLKRLNYTDLGQAKAALLSIIKRATSSFGTAGDELDCLSTARNMYDEAKTIKRIEMSGAKEFERALIQHAQQTVVCLEELKQEISEAVEHPVDDITGGLLEKTTFRLSLCRIDKPEDEWILSSGDVVKHFVQSPFFVAWYNSDKELNLAELVRKSINASEKDGGMYRTWPPPKQGADQKFYTLYRLIRPTIQRAYAKARQEELTKGIKPGQR